MKKLLAMILCIIMVLCLAACGAKQPPVSTEAPVTTEAPVASETPAEKEVYTLKLGYSTSGIPAEESPTIMWCVAFKEKVEELTEGGVIVEIYDGGQLGTAVDTTGAVSVGSVEMSNQAISILANYEPKLLAFDLAGVFKDAGSVNALTNSTWVRENIFDSLEENADIRILSCYCRGFRCFTSSKNELKVPADIAGQTIRIMDNAMYKAIVESLSANPVAISGGEMYTAMSNKVVDGHENTIFSYWQDRTYEVQDYAVMDNHTASVECGFINASFYHNLPAEYRVAIDEAAAYAQEQAEIVRANMTDVITDKLINEGGMSIYTPTEEEYQLWHDAYRQASIDFLAEKVGNEFLDDFMATYNGIA